MASSGGGVRGVLCFGASGGGVDRGLALRVKMRHVRGSGPFPRATRPGKLCFGGWGWAARPPRPPPPPAPRGAPPPKGFHMPYRQCNCESCRAKRRFPRKPKPKPPARLTWAEKQFAGHGSWSKAGP